MALLSPLDITKRPFGFCSNPSDSSVFLHDELNKNREKSIKTKKPKMLLFILSPDGKINLLPDGIVKVSDHFSTIISFCNTNSKSCAKIYPFCFLNLNSLWIGSLEVILNGRRFKISA
jgi:hypothetical protein